jgi:hypothetical protein
MKDLPSASGIFSTETLTQILSAREWRARVVLGVILCGAAIVPAAQAQVNGSENDALYGMLGQLNNAVVTGNGNQGQAVANMACFATSVANGLSFLESYQTSISQPDPFTSSASTYATVNNLITAMNITANGTGVYSSANGLVNYLSPTGGNPAPSVVVSGQIGNATPAAFKDGSLNAGVNLVTATPTASFLATALNANKAVEITLEWGTLNGTTFTRTRAGHEVALTSITLNQAGTSGTISYVDPGQAGSTSGTLMDATLTLGSDGYLDVTAAMVHVTQVAEADFDESGTPPDDIGAGVGAGRIDADIIESVVPEPTTYALAALAAVLALGMRFFRKPRNA